MASSALSDQAYQGGSALTEAMEKSGVPIEAAFWYYDQEIEEWRLVIVSPLVDTQGVKALLRKASGIMQKMNGELQFELFDINFESPYNPFIMVLGRILPIRRNMLWKSSFKDFGVPGLRIGEIYPYFIDLRSIPPAVTHDDGMPGPTGGGA